jgi:hypothetical protein
MKMDNPEMVQALRTKVEALELRNEALLVKIEALELLNQNLQFLMNVKKNSHTTVAETRSNGANGYHTHVSTAEEPSHGGTAEVAEEPQRVGKKRGRKPKPTSSQIAKLQVPLERTLRNMLSQESFNRATYRALTGILLCLFENKTATVTMLHEYIGGSRVTVVRHTALLKRMNILRYEGSRKKGHYALTDNGRALLAQLRSEVGM